MTVSPRVRRPAIFLALTLPVLIWLEIASIPLLINYGCVAVVLALVDPTPRKD